MGLKRLLDIFAAATGLVVLSPFLCVFCLLVWLQDFKSPFYVARRAGRHSRIFRMVKLRSMVVSADRSGVSSTSATDSRITPIGRFIRRFKLDELTQLWNVLIGDMSLVGPRPQVTSEIPRYTSEEMRILSVRPGITDLASIVFADEGEILSGALDTDLRYDQLIRPWKSRLALFYITHRTFLLDFRIIALTVIAILSRSRALNSVVSILQELGSDQRLIEVAKREKPLEPFHPPGATQIDANHVVPCT